MIHQVVKVGQVWSGNDQRTIRRVRIVKIVSYVTGKRVEVSRVGMGHSAELLDRVRVQSEVFPFGRLSTITRKNFNTTVRGWTLAEEGEE